MKTAFTEKEFSALDIILGGIAILVIDILLVLIHNEAVDIKLPIALIMFGFVVAGIKRLKGE